MSDALESGIDQVDAGGVTGSPLPEEAGAPSSVWRVRAYRVWLVSDTAWGLGATLFHFALPLLVLMGTNDPVKAGVLAAATQVASLLMTLFGGVWADRYSRTRLMITGGVLGAIVSAGLLAFALADSLTYAVLFVVGLLFAVRGGLFGPSTEAALKDVVPAALMGRAQAANQGRNAVLELGGGPLGGVLLAVGAWLVAASMLVVNAISAVTALVLKKMAPRADRTATQRRKDGGAIGEGSSTSVVREAAEGFKWIFGRPDITGAVWAATLINLAAATSMTTVIYSMQQSGFTPVQIGTISAAMGAAMLIGAVLASQMVRVFRAGALIIAGIGVVALGMAALVWAQSLVAIIACLVPGAFLLPAVNAALMGYFMVAVPEDFVGRANSATMILAGGLAPLGPVIAGFGLGHVGRTPTLLVGAALALSAALLGLFTRALRRIPEEAGWAAYAGEF